MNNRLPLPLATIKELMRLKELMRDNLWIANPLGNIVRHIVAYEYQDAIKMLQYLQHDHPDLMYYDKHIRLIQQAKNRYDAIPTTTI